MLEMVTPITNASVPPRRALKIFVPHASDVFTNHRPHGDGLVAFEVAKRLAERGHDVYVVAPTIAVVGPLPATLHLFEMPVGAGALGRVRYLIAVRRLFRRLHARVGFDLIHQLNPVFTGISVALADSRLPVVLGSFLPDWPAASDSREALGTLGFRGARPLKRAVAFVQQRLAARLLITTRAAQHRIVEPRRHARKIVELPHGIDSTRFAGSVSEPELPAIVFLGGFEKRKGILTLLEAFALVIRGGTACRLYVGGAGSLAEVIQDRVRELGLSDHVTLLYAVAREDVPALMASATIYCMPSDGEPFGMSLLEAMAAGKPVVVGDRGGPRHIVDGDGGLHVPANDPLALATALATLLRDPALRRSMGENNRRRVAAVYAWDSVIARLEREYLDLVAPSVIA